MVNPSDITSKMIAAAFKQFKGFKDVPACVIPPPTYFFDVGDECQVGALINCVIAEVLYEGKAYRVDCVSKDNNYGKADYSPKTGIWWWFDVEPKENYNKDAKQLFSANLPGQIYTSGIDTFTHLMSSGGLVCDSRYQRGYVWSEENQENLIDSIFNRINIGTFVFSRHSGYLHKDQSETVTYTRLDGEEVTINRKEDYTLAVIDGQQRLTTIWRFITGQFSYKGHFWKDLNPRDQGEFLTTLISYRTFDEKDVPYVDVLRMFIKVNQGVPQDSSHLEAIKTQLKELTDD